MPTATPPVDAAADTSPAASTSTATKPTKPKSTRRKSNKNKDVDVQLLNPARVKVDDALNGRTYAATDGDIRGLAVSMHNQGQLQPIEVRKLDGDKDFDYQVTFGYSRIKAAKLLVEGFTYVPPDKPDEEKELKVPSFKIKAIVSDDTLTDTAAFEHNVVENYHRKDASIVDTIFNQERLRAEHGYSDEQIAALYGRDKGYIGVLRNLQQLSPDEMKLLHQGKMSVNVARDLLKMDKDERSEVMKAAQRDDGKIDPAHVREHVRNNTKSKTGRTASEIEKFFDSEVKDENAPEAIVSFCRTMLRFKRGEVKEGAMKNALRRLYNASGD